MRKPVLALLSVLALAAPLPAAFAADDAAAQAFATRLGQLNPPLPAESTLEGVAPEYRDVYKRLRMLRRTIDQERGRIATMLSSGRPWLKDLAVMQKNRDGLQQAMQSIVQAREAVLKAQKEAEALKPESGTPQLDQAWQAAVSRWVVAPAESLQLAAGVGASVFGQAVQLADVMGTDSGAADAGGEAERESHEAIDREVTALVQRLQTVCAQVMDMIKLMEKS